MKDLQKINNNLKIETTKINEQIYKTQLENYENLINFDSSNFYANSIAQHLLENYNEKDTQQFLSTFGD